MAASKVEGERPLIKFNREIHTVIGAAVVFSYPTVFRVLTKNKTQQSWLFKSVKYHQSTVCGVCENKGEKCGAIVDYFISEKRKASLNLTVLPHNSLLFSHIILGICESDWMRISCLHHAVFWTGIPMSSYIIRTMRMQRVEMKIEALFGTHKLSFCWYWINNMRFKSAGARRRFHTFKLLYEPTVQSNRLSLSLSLTIHSTKCGNNIVVKWIKPPRPPPIKSRTECGV